MTVTAIHMNDEHSIQQHPTLEWVRVGAKVRCLFDYAADAGMVGMLFEASYPIKGSEYVIAELLEVDGMYGLGFEGLPETPFGPIRCTLTVLNGSALGFEPVEDKPA